MLSVTLWDSSSNSLALTPTFETEDGGKKIFDYNRSSAGNLYHHTYGSYREFKLVFDLLPSSIATIINSWYTSFEACTLEIVSGIGTETFSVYISGKESPFQEYSNPDCTKLKGKLNLLEY